MLTLTQEADPKYEVVIRTLLRILLVLKYEVVIRTLLRILLVLKYEVVIRTVLRILLVPKYEVVIRTLLRILLVLKVTFPSPVRFTILTAKEKKKTFLRTLCSA